MKFHRFIFPILAIALTAVFTACGCGDDDDDDTIIVEADDDAGDDDDSSEIDSVSIVIPADASEALQLAAQDAAGLLDKISGIEALVQSAVVVGASALNIVVADQDVSDIVFEDVDLTAMPAESFRIRDALLNETPAYFIVGADARGEQYGLYDLLEKFGFRFYHPEQTYTPTYGEIAWTMDLDVFESPDWNRRGFHLHTMHPIEMAEILMKDTPEHELWAKNMIDWLARNKQNYWQFELLRTTDYDSMVGYYRELIDYSHRRLVDAGVVITWVFQQQKAWKLMPTQFPGPQKEVMEEGLAQIMQAPWDHINFEMGSTEFTPVKDTDQMAWMNNTVEYLGENYPDTDASVKIHCSSGQTAPNYGDINFNYLVQEADIRMAAYPHTVMYYDLQGPAPAYDNEDFSELYDWTLEIAQTDRKVYYYPETAYWCSFDIDVPLFLPVYLFNRWKDIQLLADKGLDGHVTFTSGHEWGYWLSDIVVAKSTWDSDIDWRDIIGEFTDIFGDAGSPIKQALIDLTLNQEDRLIGENLASYLASADPWDEIGYLVGSTTHPKPVTYRELYKADADFLDDFENDVLNPLEDMAQEYADLLASVKSIRFDVPDNAKAWYEELVDSFAVNSKRADHAVNLFQGVLARRRAELGILTDGEDQAAEYFDQALGLTEEFLETMRRREESYRYPLSYSSGWQRSVTSYDYKYLYQAATGYWYRREEKQAIDKDFGIFLMNLIDPIWFFF